MPLHQYFLVNYCEGQVVAASLGSQWYVGTAETSGAAMARRENKNKMVTGKKKKMAQVHLNPCRHPSIRDGISLIIYRQYCVLPVSTNRRVGTHALAETCNLFPICENEIQVHKDNPRL